MTMLPSFEIKNFRTFDHLVIDKFAQVNLITGMNGVGKSSLLEAIYLFKNDFSPKRINKIGDINDTQSLLNHLYHNYDFQSSSLSNIVLSDSTITIEVGFNDQTKHMNDVFKRNDDNSIVVSRTNYETKNVSYQNYFSQSVAFNREEKENIYFVHTEKIADDEKYELWKEVELTEYEDDIKNGLTIIDPTLKEVRPSVYDIKTHNNYYFRARLKGYEKPVAMKSKGEGFNHLFVYLLSMAKSKEGILLIDEIENGLHYSVQPDVWKLIFTLAKRLNVQVFATTHSWDCIEAFQKASSNHEDVDCELIRLSKVKDQFRATIFEKDSLENITQAKMEVR